MIKPIEYIFTLPVANNQMTSYKLELLNEFTSIIVSVITIVIYSPPSDFWAAPVMI